MEKPTIIVTYYNEPEQLKRQESFWKDIDNRIIIIDDCSDVPVETKYESWRIDDNIQWNQPGAKNLGFYVAPDGWILYHDIDHYFYNIHAINEMEKEPGMVYFFKRRYDTGEEIPHHISSFLINRKTFWKIGGFDEIFSGAYGYDDIKFMEDIVEAGLKIVICDIFTTIFDYEQGRNRLPRDTNRNYYHMMKGKQKNQILNFNYHKL